MLLGVIADDFTGAGDIANTLAKGFQMWVACSSRSTWVFRTAQPILQWR